MRESAEGTRRLRGANDMGAQVAAGFAEQVAQGNVSLTTALNYHFTSNHYPPLPSSLVPVAIKVIGLANQGEWDKQVKLPSGIEYRGKKFAPVSAAVEAWHLESFLESQEEE